MPLQLKLTLDEERGLSLETNSSDFQEWMLTEYRGRLFEKDMKIDFSSGEKRYKFKNLNLNMLINSIDEYRNKKEYKTLKIKFNDIYNGKIN